jgi:hypothetical protein
MNKRVPERKELSQFVAMAYESNKSKVANLYDLFQELEDDGYQLVVEVCLKGPDYEEDQGSLFNADVVPLFEIDQNLEILTCIGVDFYTNGEYASWIVGNDFELLLDSNIIFTLYFGSETRISSIISQGGRFKARNDFRNAIDNFLSKINAMFDYRHIHYSSNVDESIKLICEL